MSSWNFIHIERGVKTQSNKLESPCVGVCTMFAKKKKISILRGTMEKPIYRKILRRVR